MKVSLIFSILLAIFIVPISLISYYDFYSNCEWPLEYAVETTNLAEANKYLNEAIQYAKDNGLTKGNTGLIVKVYASDDLKVWYNKLLSAQTALRELIAEPDNIEKQNKKDLTFLKLYHQTGYEKEVAFPDWISWFPYQGVIVWGWILMAGTFFFYRIKARHNYY